jgi:quercetin dioxygenase-like cupin family protein
MVGSFMSANQSWFLNSLVTFRVSESDGQDGVSVLEHRVPYGDSPPLHFHRTEDEIFHILEGEFRMQVKDREHRVGPGHIMLAPKGVPHTYRAESPQGGRFLTVTVHGDFERFVRAMSRPAGHPGLPEPDGAPSPEAIQALTAVAAQHGIEFVGPPLN